ncbi:MAG: HD domain-containing protein [Clostridia bacterium]|nr:HD domain-containing protein [Clostridia bacterium]
MNDINTVYMKMIEFDRGTARCIQHFTKVHSYCRLIGTLEGLDENTLRTLEIGALLHDIAIVPCKEKLGRTDGKTQEIEGPAYARQLLFGICDQSTIDRVCELIAHHHTYDPIIGIDHQILVEADFLVNLFEGNKDAETIKNVYENIFRTETGKKILREMFAL